MKKLTAIMMGILFAAAIAFMFNTYAAAAPPGHPGGHHGYHGYHGYHGPYWGFGPGIIVGSSSVVVDDGVLHGQTVLHQSIRTA